MRNRYAIVLALMLGVLAANLTAQQTPPTPVAADESQPVAVPEPSAQAVDYYTSGNLLWVAGQAWSLLILVALLVTGLSARLRDLANRIGRRWVFSLAIYFILFTIVTSLVDLPRLYYEEFVRQHAYGLSNQTLQKWWTDTLTVLAITCVVGPLIVWIPYLLLRRSPTRWWLYTAAAFIPIMIIANLVAPIWIAPLFNRFGPMQDKALEARILALADRAGIEGGRVFEVEKSVDTKTLNAYVAGVLNTKRIVLWDTTIARMNERELLFVMGHEMGHFVLGHVWQLIAVNFVLLLASFYGAYRTAGAVLRRYGERFGFTRARRHCLAAVAAGARLGVFVVDHARDSRVRTSCGTRSGSIRPRGDAVQPQRRHGVRQAADRRARGASSGTSQRAVAAESPAPWRPHRLRQRVPPVA